MGRLKSYVALRTFAGIDPTIPKPAARSFLGTVARSRSRGCFTKPGRITIPRFNRPETGSETDQTIIFDRVPVGRAVALPEAEQVEFADQFLEAGIAAERGHVW